MTAVDFTQFLHLLDPESFLKQALTTGKDGQMDMEIAQRVIPSL